MSEPIPESIPTSHLPPPRHTSQPPRKKPRLTSTSSQATLLQSLFKKTPEIDPSAAFATPLIPSSPSNTRQPGLPPPPEIVANVQGSSAGAGSGEFHVYKASRRREYERMRLMEEEVRQEEGDREFEARRREREEKEEKRKGKRRKDRERKKRGKGGGKNGGGVGETKDEGEEGDGEGREGAKVRNGGGGGRRVKGIALPPRERDGENESMEVDEGLVAGNEEIGVFFHDDD